jgi:ABC-type phosphate transport system substrate-binding protein
MFTSIRKSKLVKLAAATAALGSIAAIGFVGNSPASADPQQFTALAGVGSDTTQDVLNALAGFENGISYTPLQSTAATGRQQVISFNATGTDCITTRTTGVSFNRPNGSTGGRRALSRAIDGTGYGTALCSGPADISGLVDFARSSGGPSGTTGALTYIPFGRDGVSFATYRAAGSPVTTLTRAQLTTLFTNGRTTIGGVSILPCGIQTSSGTYGFWNSVTTATAGQEDTATTECNAYLGRSQENDGAALKARGDAAQTAVPGTQVIIGFSAGAYAAKSNGAAAGAPPAGVLIGSVSDNGSGVNLGAPLTGTAPNLVPSATFFNDTIFGRRVYNVFPTTVITGFGNAPLKSIFVGPTSTLCSAVSTINTFGFLVAPDCGVTTITGDLVVGQL